jgi:F0F1-type ATP synthase alpha subunit
MQVLIFYAFHKKYLNEFTTQQVNDFQDFCLEYVKKNKPELMTILRERRKLDPEIEKMLDEVIKGLAADVLARTKAKADLE